MIPEIEKWSREKIKAAQEQGLHETLNYVNTKSPFYKNHFQKFDIQVSKIKSLDDLAAIPPTTKDDMQLNHWNFLCVPKKQIAEYTTTSGTLGKPVVVALTKKDLDRLTYNEYISLMCADGCSDDLYQLLLTLDRQFMAGIAYYNGIMKMGAGAIRTGPGLPSFQLDSIINLEPTTLIAVPSFIVKVIEAAAQRGISLHQTSIKKIVCIGENIRNQDFSLNTLGKKITEQWNVQLYSTYASTEMQTAFTECTHGNGGHHHPELIITEILDSNNNAVAPGQEGELAITHLGVEGMPLIRYKTGDIVQLHEGICSCGRNTARVSPIIGRTQNMIKLKGTTLYPPGIFEILHEAGISDYVVEVSMGDLGTDTLKLVVVANEESITRVRSIFQSRFRILPDIILAASQQIEQMQLKDGLRKPMKFIDRRVRI